MRKLTLLLLFTVMIFVITSCSDNNSSSLNENTDINGSQTESLESNSGADQNNSSYVELMKEKARKIKYGDSLKTVTDTLGEYDYMIDGNKVRYLYYLSDDELILCCTDVPNGVVLCQYVNYKNLSLPFDTKYVTATDKSVESKLSGLTENDTLEDVENIFGKPTWIEKIQPGRDETEYYVYDDTVTIDKQSAQLYFAISDNKLVAKYPVVESYVDFGNVQTDSDL